MIETSTLGSTAMGALIIGAIWGGLLLFFGAALLRPMIVLAALLVGILLGVVVARAWTPQVPLWAAAAVGGVLGVIVGALLYRPTVAFAAAWVGSCVGAVVAWSVIAGGALDTQPREAGHGLVVTQREEIVAGDGAQASVELLAVFTQPADAAGGGASGTTAVATSTGDRILRDLTDIAQRAWQRLSAAMGGTAPAYRTLLYGSIATGAIIGLIAGLLATTLVARILTSAAGAVLLLCAGIPLLAHAGHTPLPNTARAWLIAAAALTAIGVVMQAVISGTQQQQKQKQPAAKQPKPKPAAA